LKKIKKLEVPTEYQEQCRIFEWARMKQLEWPELELLKGSLSGVDLRNKNKQNQWGVITRAKKAGKIKKGWPDISLSVPRNGFHGMFIELKRTKGGVVSHEQDRMLKLLQGQGYDCYVVRGADSAIKTITKYLDKKLK